MKKYFYVVASILTGFLPQITLAAFTPKEFPWNSPPLSSGAFTDLALGFAQWFYIIAMIIMGIVIIWAGLTYMAAGSDTARVGKAKAILKYGIIGAIVIFAVGTIINTISLLATDPGSFF